MWLVETSHIGGLLVSRPGQSLGECIRLCARLLHGLTTCVTTRTVSGGCIHLSISTSYIGGLLVSGLEQCLEDLSSFRLPFFTGLHFASRSEQSLGDVFSFALLQATLVDSFVKTSTVSRGCIQLCTSTRHTGGLLASWRNSLCRVYPVFLLTPVAMTRTVSRRCIYWF